jgi:hypothetical protein
VSLTAVVGVDARVIIVDIPFLRIPRRHSSRSDNRIVRTPDGACLDPSRDYDLRPRLRLRPNHAHHFPALIHLVTDAGRLRRYRRLGGRSSLLSSGRDAASCRRESACQRGPRRATRYRWYPLKTRWSWVGPGGRWPAWMPSSAGWSCLAAYLRLCPLASVGVGLRGTCLR